MAGVWGGRTPRLARCASRYNGRGMDDEIELKVAKLLGQRAEELERVTDSLANYLRYFCDRLVESEPDFRYRFVEGRHKKPPEVARALEEQGLTADEVFETDDLIGGRVVVVSQSDIQDFVRAAQENREFPVKDLEPFDLDEDSGYRATHLKGWIDSSVGRFGCEVQIRTAIADAWSVVSRADLYRRQDLAEILPKIAQIEA